MTDETTTRLPRQWPKLTANLAPMEAETQWYERKHRPRRAQPKGVYVPYWLLGLLVVLALVPTVLFIYASEVGW